MFATNFRSRRALRLSDLFDETTFHRAFVRDLRRAKRYVVIESPYLTKRRTLYYALVLERLVGRGVSVRINTRKTIYHGVDMEYQSRESIDILKSIRCQGASL